jgi:hypothetical protein
LAAALDQTNLYFFWTVTRRSGQIESGMLTRALDTQAWVTSPRLGLIELEGDPPQISFNTGSAVKPAAQGDTWLRWVAPLPGQYEVLPVAAQVEGELALVYLRNGEIIAYQALGPASGLLGPPNLRTDRERYLYVSWADTAENGPAALNLWSTRP